MAFLRSISTINTTPTIRGDRVLLPRTGDTERPGVWGLEWEGGFARLGRTLAATPATLERALEPVRGELAAGQAARMTLFAYPGNPERAHGVPFEDTSLRSELGPLPAWFVPGRRRTRPHLTRACTCSPLGWVHVTLTPDAPCAIPGVGNRLG